MPTIVINPASDLQGALDAVEVGDTLIFLPGEHYGPIEITNSVRLIGKRTRHGELPVIQCDELVDDWTLVDAPLNIWRRVFSGQTVVRSLFVAGKSISVIQCESAEVPSERLEEARVGLFATAWDVTDYTLPDEEGTPIAFWTYYQGIASIQSNGTVELRLRDDVNPNTVETRISFGTIGITLGNTQSDTNDCVIENLEIRGGNSAITAIRCPNLIIRNCRIVCNGQHPIHLKQCLGAIVRNCVVTSAPGQSNIGGGGGGTTPLARAKQFAYLLRKAFTNTEGDTGNKGVGTVGTCSVTVENNHFYDLSQAVACEPGSEFEVRNNRIERILSLGIMSSNDTTLLIENNIFHECNIGIRIEKLGGGTARDLTIQNNQFTFDLLAAQDGGRAFLLHWGAKPSIINNHIIVRENLISGGAFGIAPVDTDGVIPEGHTTILPNASWSGNVWDTAVAFAGTVGTVGLGAFQDNWVGGTLPSAVTNAAWWQASSNEYTPGQRLVDGALPGGFTEAGVAFTPYAGLKRVRRQVW